MQSELHELQVDRGRPNDFERSKKRGKEELKMHHEAEHKDRSDHVGPKVSHKIYKTVAEHSCDSNIHLFYPIFK